MSHGPHTDLGEANCALHHDFLENIAEASGQLLTLKVHQLLSRSRSDFSETPLAAVG